MNNLYYLVFVAAGIVIAGSIAMYYVESDQENSQINSYLDALWWTIATITTVGYGDTIPVSDVGKIIAMLYMIFGIAVLAIFLSVLGTKFYQRRFEKEEKKISHAQKLILHRIDDLEKNQEKLQNDLKEIIEKLKEKTA